MRRWLLALLLLAAAAFGFTLLEARAARRGPGPEAAGFARMTGGLGMGAADALYWDYETFDPRLEPDCSCSLWPVPGGFLYSPEHRATVFDPPETLSPAPARRSAPPEPAAPAGEEAPR